MTIGRLTVRVLTFDPMELEALRDEPLGRLVHLAGHLAGQRWAQLLAERFGLTPAGMAVVLTLVRSDELTHRDVADRCFVRPGTLTGIIDTLEKNGYVRRVQSPDNRREVRVALTDEGATRGREILELTRSNRPLTSVDADPTNAAVVREFLLELIRNLSQGVDIRDGGSRVTRLGEEVSQA
jgi:DNA-binding MarR family transcriptional regulator